MVNINELETTLKEQVTAGILTDFELRRIMARATGGIWLDEGQRAEYNKATTYIGDTMEILNKLHVISPKRFLSTQTKLEKAIVKHISNGGTIAKTGQPDVSNLELWE